MGLHLTNFMEFLKVSAVDKVQREPNFTIFQHDCTCREMSLRNVLTQIKMYLSDSSILKLFGRFTTVCTVYSRKLELFGRFTKVFTVYYSALKYIFIWV